MTSNRCLEPPREEGNARSCYSGRELADSVGWRGDGGQDKSRLCRKFQKKSSCICCRCLAASRHRRIVRRTTRNTVPITARPNPTHPASTRGSLAFESSRLRSPAPVSAFARARVWYPPVVTASHPFSDGGVCANLSGSPQQRSAAALTEPDSANTTQSTVKTAGRRALLCLRSPKPIVHPLLRRETLLVPSPRRQASSRARFFNYDDPMREKSKRGASVPPVGQPQYTTLAHYWFILSRTIVDADRLFGRVTMKAANLQNARQTCPRHRSNRGYRAPEAFRDTAPPFMRPQLGYSAA